MAVAFQSTVPAIGKLTGTTVTSANWTISGSNPVILVAVTFKSTTAVETAPSWSLGSGTAVLVKEVRGGSGVDVYESIWAIPAPIVGTGTVTVNIDTSLLFNSGADCFTGADQTTPAPVGDAVTDITATNSYTLTPANLTANDASYSCSGNTTFNISTVTNSTLIDNTATNDIGLGYNLGTASITVTMSDSANTHGNVAVRIVAAGGAAAVKYPQLERGIRGLGRGLAEGLARTFVRKDRIFVPAYSSRAVKAI